MTPLTTVDTHPCTCFLRGDEPRVCSHVAAQKTVKGQPIFTDKACIAKAAELKGFEIVETNQYNWYNRHMGDYPLPKGIKAHELGKNALFILRMKDPKRSEMIARYGKAPYDVGVIADPNNPGCYTLIYDFWGAGYGVDETLGAPVKVGGEIQMLCPEFKQTYDMVCESQSAIEAGDAITFMTMEQARAAHPHLFAGVPSRADDAKTWVSFADASQRVGVS